MEYLTATAVVTLPDGRRTYNRALPGDTSVADIDHVFRVWAQNINLRHATWFGERFPIVITVQGFTDVWEY